MRVSGSFKSFWEFREFLEAFESLGEFYGSFMRVLGVLIELRSLRSFLVDSELKELWEFLGVFGSSREF